MIGGPEIPDLSMHAVALAEEERTLGESILTVESALRISKQRLEAVRRALCALRELSDAGKDLERTKRGAR